MKKNVLGMFCLSILLGACRSSPNWSSIVACFQESSSSLDPQEGRVLARVEGAPITVTDCGLTLQNYPPVFRSRLASKEGRQAFLNQLIQEKTVAQLAQKAGLDRDPGYRLKVRQFQQALLAQAYEHYLIQNMPISEQDLLKMYAAKTPNNSTGWKIAASHIVLPSQERAKQAKALLKAGVSFPVVAQAMSVDKATAKQGGNLGILRARDRDAVFEKVLLRLKDGQVSDIFKTDQGYEIIRRDGPASSAAIAQDIEKTRHSIQSEYIYKRIERAKASMKIEIDPSALDSLIPLASTTSVSGPESGSIR